MMNEKDSAALARLVDHAENAFNPRPVPDGVEADSPYVVIPQGHKIEKMGYTPLVPSRIRAVVVVDDHVSFCTYVGDFKTASTRIFATVKEDGGLFYAMLDYHAENRASHCSHNVQFEPAKSVNWRRWCEKNRKSLTQEEFALFLEDNLGDVRTPSGADLLAVINTLTISGELRFSRAQRTTDGTATLLYADERKASGGSGSLDFPSNLVLALPVFDGEPNVMLKVRLRYRLSTEGVISFSFEMINPHLAVRESMLALIDRVAKGTGLTPLLGRYQCKQNTARAN